ncbi:MAG: hypothetical protein CL398_10480 [Acidiferrobacteraceae bacterium]|nr:hypothetical protein [Acidiferrobacteraceae bacterium]
MTSSVPGEFVRQLSAALEEADMLMRQQISNGAEWVSRFRATLDSFVDSPVTATLHNKPTATANAWLRDALASLDGSTEFVSAVQAAANAANWYQIYNVDAAESGAMRSNMHALAEGMFAAQVIGPRGLIPSKKLLTGLFLLRAGLHYPLHQHEATEIYFCASGKLRIQHGIDTPPQQLIPGQFSLTPSNRLHSLTMGDAPVLLLYIWLGEFGGKNWWWHKDDNGVWQREAWERQPDAVWAKTITEVVPYSELILANKDK